MPAPVFATPHRLTTDAGVAAGSAMRASMHADLMAGRPLELEALNGAAVRAGAAANTPTPINDVIYAALKPFVNGKE